MPLCPVSNETIAFDMWCNSCDKTHKKTHTVAKQRYNYILSIIGMQIIYLFSLWLEVNNL